MGAWVTRPERPKGVKDEVKDARRAKSRPEGPPTRSRARRAHRLLVYDIFQSKFQALDLSEPRVRLVLQLPFQHSGVFLMSRDKLLDTQGRWKPEY